MLFNRCPLCESEISINCAPRWAFKMINVKFRDRYMESTKEIRWKSNLARIIFFMVILQGCQPYSPKEEEPLENINEGITYIPDMKTPQGERLLPAQEGPERSALGVPEIDIKSFKLEITGLVDSTYSLSWDEIQRLPKFKTDIMLMYCVEGWEVWGSWEGIRVKDLLGAAKVRSNGKYVLFSSADGGYSTSHAIAYLEKYDVILASNVNGIPLSTTDGFPLRLIAVGKYGYKWIKWVNKLEVTDFSIAGYWESHGYLDDAEVPVYRRKFYEGENAKPLDY